LCASALKGSISIFTPTEASARPCPDWSKETYRETERELRWAKWFYGRNDREIETEISNQAEN
jgi:hypothetical protein